MALINIQGFSCERCNHIWAPRLDSRKMPLVCPGCKSPYWNIPRQRKVKGVIKK